MKPIKFEARELRRICLSASSDLALPHICAIRFRPGDVVATNGSLLLRVPLPHDAERDFVLAAAPLVALIAKRRHTTITVARGEGGTRVSIAGDASFAVADNAGMTVDQYPPIDRIIDEALDVGEVGDISLSARMLIKIGKIARDLYPIEQLDEEPDRDFGGRIPDDATTTWVKAGSLKRFTPAHLTVRSRHGDALIVAMPVKR